MTAAALLGVVAMLLKPDHYKAIRHEFYQVWEDIDRLKGEEHEASESGV